MGVEFVEQFLLVRARKLPVEELFRAFFEESRPTRLFFAGVDGKEQLLLKAGQHLTGR